MNVGNIWVNQRDRVVPFVHCLGFKYDEMTMKFEEVPQNSGFP